MAIIIMGTIGIATAGPPASCACTGCNTAGCSVGDDTDCTHGYRISNDGYTSAACACPGYNTTATGGNGPYYTDYYGIDDVGNTNLPAFASCAAFGAAVGGPAVAVATACCSYCCGPPPTTAATATGGD
ncbi:unnamed protein product [Rotaria socialis]|uniref:Uncharacterized protein n=1 Tax=Rotaria socialis TaxID=392032 RepID=A0A821QCN4_9BILA|nr:unnamed protein product [Rotaria socialis]